MHLITGVVGASSGVLASPWLRAVIFRLAVPFGQPERTNCSLCGRGLLRTGQRWSTLPPVGPCPGCGARIGIPLGPLAIAAGALLGLVAAVVGPRPVLFAFGLLALAALALATIDVLVHRLPDRLTLPTSVLLAALLGMAAVFAGEPQRFVRVLCVGVTFAGAHLLLALLRPDQLGLGDVKLAWVLGLALGWLGWAGVVFATTGEFVGCGVVGLVLLLRRRVQLGTLLPLGPFMVAGTFGTVLVTWSW